MSSTETTTTPEAPRDQVGGDAAPADRYLGLGVLVVDDDVSLCSRVCDLLEAAPELRVAGVAHSAEEAMCIAEHELIDIAVIGQRLRSRSGLWLCRELKRIDTPPMVVICSMYPDPVLTAACAVVEADALVSVHDTDEELAGVLDRVAHGMGFLPPVPPYVGAVLRDRLDDAEHAIFGMLLAGVPASDVARGLRISRAEFESRRSALLGKLESLPPVSRIRH